MNSTVLVILLLGWPDEVCGSCRASKLRQSDAFAISWWGSPSRQFRLLVSKAKQVFRSHRTCLNMFEVCFVVFCIVFFHLSVAVGA